MSNLPEFSVSEIASAIKQTMEESFARVRVRGELSKVKIHTSGHLYSDLKDADSVLSLVCWRGQVAKLPIKPEEGMEVICTGRITTYPARSNYQLVVETMELAGAGALLKLLEDRRRKLAAEGLFEAARKKPIPLFPRVIGVVTSPTGAVIRDILHRVADRLPCHVLVWPVNVQGTGAEEQIAGAITGFHTAPLNARPDVIIVARGGGSLEDLMPFNAESVVRAVANCPIPIISAVGHETDTTLIDYAADLRAPTPTAAAEFATQDRMSVIFTINDYASRGAKALQRRITEYAARFQLIGSRLIDPLRYFETRIQKLDHLFDQLRFALSRNVARGRENFLRVSARLTPPKTRFDMAQQKLDGLGRMLETLSYKSTLKRGFAVVRQKGRIVSHVKNTDESDLNITFQDGEISVKKI
jgi:exodeoxyribonuclease VII large subunit